MPTDQCITNRPMRVLLSILVVLHFLAVVLPPTSLQARGPLGLSPFIAKILHPLESYCQFLYIDRGYAFFAPDPGPSHLLQVRVEESNGEFKEYLYPDLNRQWPRLKYHRHFMLSEFLHDLYRPKVMSGNELSRLQESRSIAERGRYERVLHSYSNHLQYSFGGKRISLRRLEHLLPSYEQYLLDPLPLNHPDSYRVLRDINTGRVETSQPEDDLQRGHSHEVMASGLIIEGRARGEIAQDLPTDSRGESLD